MGTPQREDAARCHPAWLADPVDGPLRVSSVKRFGYSASLIHGEEVGAFAACPDLLDALCATLDYPVATEVVACVPTANVLLLSDEPVEIVTKILAARPVWTRELEASADPGLGPGPKVGCLSSIVVRSAASDYGLRDRLLRLDPAVRRGVAAPGKTPSEFNRP